MFFAKFLSVSNTFNIVDIFSFDFSPLIIGNLFLNLLTLKAILKNNGWVYDNHGKEDDEIFKWGNLLQFHHILEI